MYRRRQTASLRLTRMPEFHLVGFFKTVLPRSECKENIFIDLRLRNIITKFLKRHSKAKRRAPAYSRALRLVRRVVQERSPREVRVRFPVDQRGQSSC